MTEISIVQDNKFILLCNPTGRGRRERGLGLTSRHGHTSSWPIVIFNIDDLMIDNIVSTFIDASTVWAGFECLGDVFDIEDIGVKDVLGPLSVSGVWL